MSSDIGFVPASNFRQTESSGVLRKRIELRSELIQMRKINPGLAKSLVKLDHMLENLLTLAADYDKMVNMQEDIESLSEWEMRLMRCRYVLGVD